MRLKANTEQPTSPTSQFYCIIKRDFRLTRTATIILQSDHYVPSHVVKSGSPSHIAENINLQFDKSADVKWFYNTRFTVRRFQDDIAGKQYLLK